MALHTMAIFQAYQSDVLKEMYEDVGLTQEAVKELRRATDLVLYATKHTTCMVGHTMAGLAAVKCHLWLNLTKRKRFPTGRPHLSLKFVWESGQLSG